jgi:hypothetical protein
MITVLKKTIAITTIRELIAFLRRPSTITTASKIASAIRIGIGFVITNVIRITKLTLIQCSSFGRFGWSSHCHTGDKDTDKDERSHCV